MSRSENKRRLCNLKINAYKEIKGGNLFFQGDKKKLRKTGAWKSQSVKKFLYLESRIRMDTNNDRVWRFNF